MCCFGRCGSPCGPNGEYLGQGHPRHYAPGGQYYREPPGREILGRGELRRGVSEGGALVRGALVRGAPGRDGLGRGAPRRGGFGRGGFAGGAGFVGGPGFWQEGNNVGRGRGAYGGGLRGGLRGGMARGGLRDGRGRGRGSQFPNNNSKLHSHSYSSPSKPGPRKIPRRYVPSSRPVIKFMYISASCTPVSLLSNPTTYHTQ
jgi:hypothetical protein